jgi:hypothetical protein
MVIGDFDFIGMTFLPDKTDPVLLIDADAVLICSITFQSFQVVARWYSEFRDVAYSVELIQFSTGY